MVQKHRLPQSGVTRSSAAGKLIIKRGAEHVTVQRIAVEVGITEAAIYRHFKSKKDILRLLLGDIEQTLVEDISSHRSDGPTPLDVLDACPTSGRPHLSA